MKTLLLYLLLLTTFASTAAEELQPTHDLQALAQQARNEHKKILLLVSLEDCPWCEKLKTEVLNPMLLAGDFSNQLIIAEIRMDAGWHVKDFNGKTLDGSVWAGKRHIFTSPTLLFLEPDGTEKVERILGYNSADLFPYYLEENIQALLQANS